MNEVLGANVLAYIAVVAARLVDQMQLVTHDPARKTFHPKLANAALATYAAAVGVFR
ncbi:MAG: hypothetical protein WB438_04275 [Candidatus Cybelea sp.]